MSTIEKLVNQFLAIFLVTLFSMLVCCVVWQVISRYILGSPSIITDELARFLFMWLGLIGSAFTTGLKRHLAIDLLLVKLKGSKQRLLEILIILTMIFFSGYILLYGGGVLAWDTHISGQVSPSLEIDMGMVYFCLPLSGAIMLFYLSLELIAKIRQQSISAEV